MDTFEQSLAKKITRKVETVTLERIMNFYNFLNGQGMFGSICLYQSELGKYSCWAVKRTVKVYEGNGDTISDALDDILNEFKKAGLF